MDLRDAMIDEARSAPLARGRMTLHSAEAGAISTLAGAHEVFCFQRDDFAITISSVLSHAINVRGFHRATLAYPKLTMTLPIQASLRPLTTSDPALSVGAGWGALSMALRNKRSARGSARSRMI